MAGTRTSQKKVGEIVAEDYRTATVFKKYGIDFCCGGQKPLIAACQAKDLDFDAIQLEIDAVKAQPIEQRYDYTNWELSFLTDYIVNTHHAYLNKEMEPIAALAHKIADIHGINHPEVIKIATIFDKVVSDMAGHLREEEDVFFPAIKRVEALKKKGSTPASEDCEMIKTSLEKLHREHEDVGDAIHEIRHLANDYAIPEDVCNTFAVTYKKLKEFENDLHHHVHLENNILFLKAARF